MDKRSSTALIAPDGLNCNIISRRECVKGTWEREERCFREEDLPAFLLGFGPGASLNGDGFPASLVVPVGALVLFALQERLFP